MSPDPMRDLLADVARPTMDLPPGWMAAPFGHVQAHGAEATIDLGDDRVLVRAWVESRGGLVDAPQEPKSRGLIAGRTLASATTTDRRRFVFPDAALAE